jgi:hypothetical protein
MDGEYLESSSFEFGISDAAVRVISWALH